MADALETPSEMLQPDINNVCIFLSKMTKLKLLISA